MKYKYLTKEIVKELTEKIRNARKDGAYHLDAFSCRYGYMIASMPCKVAPFLRMLDYTKGKVDIRIFYSEAVCEKFSIDIP